MAYQTYTTEALVCGTWDRNTSDKSYLLFTREAGMLYADARSARMEKSKQRYALQDFSHVRVSLVKGKGGWRVGSVESLKNYYQVATTRASRGAVVSTYRFLRRFFKGETSDPELFDYIAKALSFVVSTGNTLTAEVLIKINILAQLGYVNKAKLPTDCLFNDFSKIEEVSDEQVVKIEKLLEHATDSSQL